MKRFRLFGLCLLLSLLACEKNPPEINRVFWQVTYRNDLALNREVVDLALFVNVSDEDGTDDIEKVFVFKDDEQLYWELTADNWIKSVIDEQTWVGSNQLRSVDYSRPPAGAYRVVLQDLGGETAENYLQVNLPRVRRNYPEVTIEDGVMTLGGTQASYAVRVYNSNGSFVNQFFFNRGQEVNLQEELFLRNNLSRDASFEVYYFDKAQDAGFATGPFYL